MLVSAQSRYAIKGYAQEIALYNRPGVYLVSDKKLQFGKIFCTVPVPTNFVYNSQFLLKKRLIGMHSINDLLQIAEGQ